MSKATPTDNREVKIFLAQLTGQSWVILSWNKHIKVQAPSGAIMGIPKTPGDRRSMLNARAQARRLGANIPHV